VIPPAIGLDPTPGQPAILAFENAPVATGVADLEIREIDVGEMVVDVSSSEGAPSPAGVGEEEHIGVPGSLVADCGIAPALPAVVGGRGFHEQAET